MTTVAAAAPVPPTVPLAPAAGGAFPMHPSGSLYVGDLAPDVTEALLFEIFSRAGAVSSIRVCRDATSRRSLGYAYVNFHSVMDAERALDTMNYQVIKDRPCRIMWSHRDPAARKNTRNNVFIKNLALSIDSKQLYDTFSKFGNILSCKVAIDPVTGQSRGFGYVHFETEESAAKAIDEVNGHTIAGKQVYVGHFERRTERTTAVNKFTNVYVKNLPADWDENKFMSEFGRFGKVTSVAIRHSGEKHSGLCFGFVNFDSHEEATRAIDEGNKMTYNGLPLFCDRFQKRGERLAMLGKLYEDRRREKVEKFKNLNLYVKNIDEEVDDAKLRELFAPFGEISSCLIMKDDKGVSRGFGFVCFVNPDDAGKALNELNGKVVGSKPLYVNRAQRKEERRMQLEQTFIGSQRMPVAMYFPPNIPMQPQFVPMQPPFRQRMPQPVAMRGYPGQQPYFPGASRGGSRGRGGAAVPMRGAYPPNMNPRGGRGVARGAPQGARYPREQGMPQMPMMMQPPQELSASMLASASPEVQKQILGERLYPLVFKENPKLASKITGMFLEMETSEILSLLEVPSELRGKVQEAMAVLEQTNQPTA
jgi:polyadenylate-binding protein